MFLAPNVFERQRPPGDQPVRQQNEAGEQQEQGRDADHDSEPRRCPRHHRIQQDVAVDDEQRVSHDVNERSQAERGDGRDQGGAQSGDRRSAARVDVLLGFGGIESLDQTPARYRAISRGRTEIALPPTGRWRRTWTNRDPAVSRGEPRRCLLRALPVRTYGRCGRTRTPLRRRR
jgi:hypothetical protein